MNQGKFITLEGGEGAGKTTQIQFIKSFLEAHGKTVLLTREPGGSLGGELIRDLLVKRISYSWDPFTEYLLFSAARHDHIVRVIKPALEEGKWVLCDRYYDSSVVYQGYARGVPFGKLETIYNLISEGLVPNLTLILDITPEIGLMRAKKRANQEDRFEQMSIQFHHTIRQGFKEIAQKNPHRCSIVKADDSVDQIKIKIIDIIQSRLF